MEFLEDQQHTESSEWTVDTKDCGEYITIIITYNKNEVGIYIVVESKDPQINTCIINYTFQLQTNNNYVI